MLAVRGAKIHLPPHHDVDLDGEIKPGILNSVEFLVSNVQQVTTWWIYTDMSIHDEIDHELFSALESYCNIHFDATLRVVTLS